MKSCWAFLLLAICLNGFGVEVIPPAPKHYFNDYANVVSGSVAADLDRQLENFERASSDQVLVAIFPKMQTDSSIEDYTVRVFRAWKVGQSDRNNGVVLFIFIQDHKMFLQVGYGLEGVLPDALCKRIIDDEITPRFKAGDFSGGTSAGVQAIIQAIRGEYQGNGRTMADKRDNANSPGGLVFAIIFIAILILVISRAGRSGRRGGSGWIVTGGGFGGWGGGGGFSGGGGGFSGGGGSSGGGGAGGSW